MAASLCASRPFAEQLVTTMSAGAHTRSVPAMVDAVAERYPDALAVSCPDSRLSYAELVADSTTAAQSMWASGVRRGDRVAFLLTDVSAEHIALLLGTLRLGAVAVTLNARAKVRELNFVLERAAPSILITASWF